MKEQGEEEVPSSPPLWGEERRVPPQTHASFEDKKVLKNVWPFIPLRRERKQATSAAAWHSEHPEHRCIIHLQNPAQLFQELLAGPSKAHSHLPHQLPACDRARGGLQSVKTPHRSAATSQRAIWKEITSQKTGALGLAIWQMAPRSSQEACHSNLSIALAHDSAAQGNTPPPWLQMTAPAALPPCIFSM